MPENKLTSSEILALAQKHGTGPMARGAALFHANAAAGSGTSGRGLPQGQFRFVSDLNDSPRVERKRYQHPADRSPVDALRQTRQGEPLTAVELAWLERLPKDAKAVSFADAQQLAALADRMSTSGGIGGKANSPIERSLVDAHWAPVREYHDREAAKVELANARLPMTDVPASVRDALVEALREEHPGLSDNALIEEAHNRLDPVIARRDVEYGQNRQAAENRLTELDRAAADRVAVTRPLESKAS